jgi:hypothetical protein
MLKRNKIVLVVGVLAVLSAGGGVAFAANESEADEPALVTGADADTARAAAQKVVPEGTAGAVERDTEGRVGYDVAVVRRDGQTVHVQLASDFSLLGTTDGAAGENDHGDH